MIRRTLMMALLAAFMLLPGIAVAQRPPAPAGGENLSRQELVERLQRRYEDHLARELQLTPEQREVFFDVLMSFGARRAQILPRRLGLMREIGEISAQGGSDERARVLIREVRELREAEARLLAQEEDRLLEILSPAQVLTLQLLRDQFGDQIRRLAGDESGPRSFGPSRGGSGAGPPR